MAAIALWFCLRLPSCGPGIESQAHHLCFFQFVLKLKREKNQNKQKEAGIGPFLKRISLIRSYDPTPTTKGSCLYKLSELDLLNSIPT